MKATASRTDDLGRAVDYALKQGADRRGFGFLRLLSANAVYQTPDEIVVEFLKVRALRPDAVRPYLLLTLSLKNEVLTRRRWSTVLCWILERIGLSPTKHQFISQRHSDTKRDHSHSVVNRVGIDGSLWCGEWEMYRLIDACQAAERHFGLEFSEGMLPAHSNLPRRREREADHESVIFANMTSMRVQKRVQDTIEMTRTLMSCSDRAQDFAEFCVLAEQRGILVKHHRVPDGAVMGVVVKEHWAKRFVGLSRVTRRRLSQRTLEDRFELNRALKACTEFEMVVKAKGQAAAEAVAMAVAATEAQADAQAEAGLATTVASDQYNDLNRNQDQDEDEDENEDQDQDQDENEDQDQNQNQNQNQTQNQDTECDRNVDACDEIGDADADR